MQEKTEDEMEDTRLINNQAEIVGEIVTDYEFSHEIFGEKFYLVHVLVERLSGLTDEIPVLISERIVDVSQDHFGRLIRVKGQYRSYNKHDGEKSRLMLSMYAREVEFLEEKPNAKTNNQVFLDGFVCKKPIYRKTRSKSSMSNLLFFS